MKSKLIIPILITLLSLISFSVFAVPPAISYQGYLTDPSGSPVDGNVDITFSLYDAETSGSHSWQETQISVAVSKGLFKVDLGAISPFATGQFDIPMWLGIKVGVDAEMSPRQPLSSVGYAFKAEDAETLGGLSPVDLNQSAHVTNAANPHNVTAAQAGAATITALGLHTTNSANPHNVSSIQIGAATTSDLNSHKINTAAHHSKYTNAEAIAAMNTKADINALNHDKYTDNAAVLAIKANDGAGSTLDADLLDGMQANELIDAASDEVRTPIPNNSSEFRITLPGSYYLTGNKTVTNGFGIRVSAANVTVDLMGFTIQGAAASTSHGIQVDTGYVTIKNGHIRGFGGSGVFSFGIYTSVINVEADMNEGTGINLSNSSGSIIDNCLSHMNNGSGFGSGENSVIKNSAAIDNKGEYGIYALSDSAVLNNKVMGNSKWGIYSFNSMLLVNNAVNNNNTTNTAGYGGVHSGKNSKVKNSLVNRNLGNGITVGEGNLITGNTVNENSLNGIQTGIDSKVQDNIINKNGNHGIIANEGNFITGNVANDNAVNGIEARDHSILIANLVNMNGYWGIYAYGASTLEDNKVYYNNQAQINAVGGIHVLNDSLVENNTAFRNFYAGIIVASSDNVLRSNHVTDSPAVGGTSLCYQFNSSDNVIVENTATGCIFAFDGAVPTGSKAVGNIAW